MIFPIVGFIIGVVLGVIRAGRLDGAPADKVQYGLVYGIIFALIGLFVLIAVDRLMM